MAEEHEAYWNEDEQDGYRLVYKRYEPKADLIAAVYFRRPVYRAVIFEKVPDHYGGHSKWIERRPAALYNSHAEATDTVERLLIEAYIAAGTTVDLPSEFNARDRRGVRYLKGKQVVPTWTTIVRDFIVGSVVLFVVIAFSATAFAWLRLSARKYSSETMSEYFVFNLYIAGLVTSFVTIGATVRSIRLRNTLLKLKAVDLVAEQWGVSSDDVQRMADAKRIMPQVNINGTDYYNPGDFGDMTTLLQPASAPSKEVLLQPVSATTTNEELLLRSSASSGTDSESSL